jgi:hypothetical protein
MELAMTGEMVVSTELGLTFAVLAVAVLGLLVQTGTYPQTQLRREILAREGMLPQTL